MPIHRFARLALALLIVIVLPAAGSAQSLGIGPRVSFVRGDLPSSTPSSRFAGGTLRMSSSRHMVWELALDYRSEYSADRSTRHRETPLQASMLLFPARGVLAPYLLGGIGLYSELVDSLDASGKVIETAATRKTGWHLGGGAELFVNRHAALFADYRFRFVQFGDAASEGEPIKIPGLDTLRLSHKGSMWTSGMAFYF